MCDLSQWKTAGFRKGWKTISLILLSALIVLQFCGCGEGTEQIQESDSVTENVDEVSEALGETDVFSIAELEWKDNSLDVYSAVINVPLRVDAPEDAIEGGVSSLFLGNSTAFYFKKHFLSPFERSWDELSYVNVDEEENSVSWNHDNSIGSMGPVLGTDHYIAQRNLRADEESRYEYRFIEMNVNQEVLNEVSVDFLKENGVIEKPIADKTGNIHFIFEPVESHGDYSVIVADKWHYYIASSEGELLADYSAEGESQPVFVSLYDGRVAFWMKSGKDAVLQYIDTDSGQQDTLATVKDTAGKDFNSYTYTLLDENTLLYADSQGVYRSDLSGNNPELLYLWRNHGIIAYGVRAMQPVDGEKIALIYESYDGMNYLCLEPTTEEVEIREIVLAVPSSKKDVYAKAVAAFNRRYPTCQIKLKNDYLETALLTELTAGNGPVLIDTALTGFENYEDLWEPLDTVLEQMGITDQLEQSVLECGRINGTLYGIISDFRLETVVTANQELQDWDYETFLQCITENPDLEAIINSYTGDDGWYFIVKFFIHGLEDNYLLDAESGVTNFDSEEFRRILELAKEYCVRNDYVAPGGSLFEGRVLCNVLSIEKPEQIALYRICYGEDINYIGFPSGDGAAHYFNSSTPLTIRRTASKEEKEIACAFIKFYLSYECQLEASKEVNYGLSVRKDVLEEQINSMNESSFPYASGFEQIQLGENVNIELDAETLYSLIEKAKPAKTFPRELISILIEEIDPYFSGAVSEDVVIDHLENRVGLYLSEQQ